MGPSFKKIRTGVVGMRRGDTLSHPCFYFIDDGLGGGDLLFESAKVPRHQILSVVDPAFSKIPLFNSAIEYRCKLD